MSDADRIFAGVRPALYPDELDDIGGYLVRRSAAQAGFFRADDLIPDVTFTADVGEVAA